MLVVNLATNASELWSHLVAQFLTNASGTIRGLNLNLMQVVFNVGRIFNQYNPDQLTDVQSNSGSRMQWLIK